jgi:enoyl-CoA hydratase
MAELVKMERLNGVAHVILNAPPANAMSTELMQQLDDTVADVANDPECRAVVFRSALEKIFMAGADLKHLLQLEEDGFRGYIKTAQDVFNRIERIPKPTIAVLSGHTLGGGCELALCCDFRLMAESGALIGLPEVTLGLLPGAGGTQRLSRLVGRSKATELLLRGNTLQGPEALALGMVHRILPKETLLEESVRFAAELAKGATQAISRIKECLRIPAQETLSDGLAQELEGIAYLFAHTQDCREGIRAFQEKRSPKYTGR